MGKPILLHCCCAVCASSCVERLQSEGRVVTLFYSNSNIAPEAEYRKRLESMELLAEITGCRLLTDDYRHDLWRTAVAGLEEEPERGARCRVCFGFSLSRAAECAARLGIAGFTTSLTVSPLKDSKVIFDAGSRFPGFEPYNFKKQDGYKRSGELAGKYGLYRQKYCGCEFSFRAPAELPRCGEKPAPAPLE